MHVAGRTCAEMRLVGVRAEMGSVRVRVELNSFCKCCVLACRQLHRLGLAP